MSGLQDPAMSPVLNYIRNDVIIDGQPIEEVYNSEISSSNEPNDLISMATIYPNPAIDLVNISIRPIQEKIPTISAFDISGRRTALTRLDDNRFDIKPLKYGMYILKMNLNSGKIIRQKLMVTR